MYYIVKGRYCQHPFTNLYDKSIPYAEGLLRFLLHKEMSKLYKEQMQIGFSKFLPQIALGQSQSSILANAYFENDILDLVNVFIPPLMSSTMNAEALNRKDVGLKEGQAGANGQTAKAAPGEEKKVGRQEKPDDEKSEKTIANKESMS